MSASVQIKYDKGVTHCVLTDLPKSIQAHVHPFPTTTPADTMRMCDCITDSESDA